MRTALLARIDGIDTCGVVTDAHLAAITGTLNLARAGISSLQADDFSGLTGLTVLYLYYNQLGALPAGVFSDLTSLTQLLLGSNQLKTLPAGVFDDLTSLRELRLLSNHLETLRQEVFANLDKLHILDLEFNKLQTLPMGMFDGLDLSFLGLEGNRLRMLSTGMFSGLNVEVLDLSHNETSAVSAEVFSGLTKLTDLDLGNNRLETLPAGVFDGLTSLRLLWLEKNPGTDFTFTMTVERRPGTNKVAVTVAQGAPFDMTTTISATGGALPDGVSSVTVPAGRTTSEEITVTPLEGTTITLGAAPPVPGSELRFNGFATAVGEPVTFSGEALLHGISADVPSLPALSVADAETQEADGAAFTYVVPAFTDADDDPLTYAAALSDGGPLPAWLTFDLATRTFTGRPGPGDTGTVRVTVMVSDGTATISHEFTLIVTVPNTPPEVATPLADQEAPVDVPFTYGIPADAFTDADGDPLTYGAATNNKGGLPGWLTFDPATRTFTGTPAASDSGTVRVTVTANDGTATVSDEFALRVLVVASSTLRAWTSRFGRTVATHVTDAVGARLRAAPGQDSHVTVGGYRLPLGRQVAGRAGPDATDPETVMDPETTTKPKTPLARLTSLLTGLVGRALGLGPAPPQGGDRPAPRVDHPEPDPRLGQTHTLSLPTVRLRDVLLGSSFRLNLGDDDAAPGHLRLTAWGRVAGTQFTGRDGALTLDGDVLTGTLGVDSEWARWLAGVAVSHSLGGGSFTGDGAGDLDSSTLTSLHPYLRYAVNERVEVWSVLGYGWGDLTLEPGTGGTLETDTTLLMGSFGGRGILLAAVDNAGYQLATRTDAMLTRTTSGAVAGLAATDAEAHRLRLVLEGSRGFAWEAGRSFTPTVEVGLRHDWGDAETGFGLELGGRVQYADPALGLTIEAAVRGLLAHEDRDYEEWGASGTVRLDPGASGRGLSLTLAPTWGAASSGVDGLWSRQTTAGLAPSGRPPAQAGRLNAQVGYGLWLPSTGGLVTPFTGVSVTDGDGWRTRAGLLFVRPDPWGGGLRLELAGESSTTAVGQAEQTIGLQLQFTFGRGRGAVPETPGRGGTVRATPFRSPTAPDGVGPGSQPPTPTRADPGRRQGAVKPPATAQTPVPRQKTSPASALDRADGPRYFVQLGLFSNHADALRAKTDLAGALRELLRRHHRRLAVVRSTGTGRARVVYVQPFPTPDAAAVLCAAIQTHGPACAVTAAWPKPDKASRGLHVAKIRGGG